MSYLDEYKWQKYIERGQPLLLFAFFDKPYGKMLKEITGFGFSKQLYYFKNDLGVFYKLESDLSESDIYFAKLLKNKDKRIELWFQKEKQCHELAKSLTPEMSVRQIVSLFQEILLYNSTIPFRLLSASTKVKLNKKVVNKLESIRLYSLYPNIIESFFPKVFKKLSKKTGISKDLFFLCTPEELILLDENKIVLKEKNLMIRMQGCHFIDDSDWKFITSSTDNLEIISKKGGLRGEIAFKGVAKGMVKIVNKPRDMNKFNEGDIIVSINTNPSLTPIIIKCSAIITDEGGITCHASIVSREYKKPCIIGTKYATKILKDGDLVEVDANKGVIKIIHNKK